MATVRLVRRTRVEDKDRTPTERRFENTATRLGTTRKGIAPYDTARAEEEVLAWGVTRQIGEWITKRTSEERDNHGYLIGWNSLEQLLIACEKVLNASHLVPDTWFAEDVKTDGSLDRKALADPKKTIKNVNVAHKLLPAYHGYGSSGEYDEAYLQDVEDTRDWLLDMFAARREDTGAKVYYATY